MDAYDGIENLEAALDGGDIRDDSLRVLAQAAKRVADLWNDPPLAWQSGEVRKIFPELGEALDELLGGGPN